jgi:chromosome segregation protein
MFESPASVAGAVRSGKVKALAITASRRDPALPEVPTAIEGGLAGFEVWSWNGLVAPDGTPPAIVARLANDTRKAFETVFPVLFPGGTGSIFLTDPENMLTTGIEVNVKPVGKRIERLSLLSGGERSLAAVALLIAIFKARPSPFYVMDEVEAALDDANLGRLLQIFQDLRQTSQLIIVTHQKRTMEIADALYGVSMRQDGVSAVVGQRLEKGKVVEETKV